jgi:DNA-binding Lrp family transcriptional regulator
MLQATIDSTDIRILKQLQGDGRLTNVELATRVNLSPSPCLARVRALERAGVISRYVALVDPATVGLGLSVFIQISLDRQTGTAIELFEGTVRRYPEVVECYLMTGDSDYLLRVVVPDVQTLKEFILNGLSSIDCVASIRSSFALKQVKYDTALPLPSPAAKSSWPAHARGRRSQSPIKQAASAPANQRRPRS